MFIIWGSDFFGYKSPFFLFSLICLFPLNFFCVPTKWGSRHLLCADLLYLLLRFDFDCLISDEFVYVVVKLSSFSSLWAPSILLSLSSFLLSFSLLHSPRLNNVLDFWQDTWKVKGKISSMLLYSPKFLVFCYEKGRGVIVFCCLFYMRTFFLFYILCFFLGLISTPFVSC